MRSLLFGRSSSISRGRSRLLSPQRAHSYSYQRRSPIRRSKNYLTTQVRARSPIHLPLPASPATVGYDKDMAGSAQQATMGDRKALIHNTGQFSHPSVLKETNQQFSQWQQPSLPTPYPPYYLAPTPPIPTYPGSCPAATTPGFPAATPHLESYRAPASDEPRYKCSICGRFRSPRFHYKHPIPPGQFPAKTICKKCREDGTDSESSCHEVYLRRARSRSRDLASISVHVARPVLSGSDEEPPLRRKSRSKYVFRGRSPRADLWDGGSSPASDLSSDYDKDLVSVWRSGCRDRPRRSRSADSTACWEYRVREGSPRRQSSQRSTIRVETNSSARRDNGFPQDAVYYSDHECDLEVVARRFVCVSCS